MNVRATFNTGMRGDKLAYHSGMVQGTDLHKQIRQSLPPVSFRAWGKWDVTDNWACILSHSHRTRTLLG